MATILVSGFDGFAGHDRNPSWEAIKDLPEKYGQVTVAKIKLPVEYNKAGQLLIEEAQRLKPDAIISFGLAGGESYLRVEQRGYNYRGGIADNAGNAWKGLVLQPESAAVGSLASIDPAKVAQWANRGPVEARVNYNAGDYVCNDIAYSVPQLLPGTPFIFIHTMAVTGDPQYDSTYKKVPLADLVTSVKHIIDGVTTNVLGAPSDPAWLTSTGTTPTPGEDTTPETTIVGTPKPYDDADVPAPWVSGKQYKVGDKVIDNGKTYIATANHTSSRSFQPGGYGGWKEMWALLGAYAEGYEPETDIITKGYVNGTGQKNVVAFRYYGGFKDVATPPAATFIGTSNINMLDSSNHYVGTPIGTKVRFTIWPENDPANKLTTNAYGPNGHATQDAVDLPAITYSPSAYYTNPVIQIWATPPNGTFGDRSYIIEVEGEWHTGETSLRRFRLDYLNRKFEEILATQWS